MSAECRLPISGRFEAQISKANQTTFSIDSQTISGFGQCVQKLGSELFILVNNSGDFTCLRLRPRSRNVVTIFSLRGGGKETAKSAEEAVLRCPSESLIRYRDRDVVEISLFRQNYEPQPCPLKDAFYDFSYTRHAHFPRPSDRCLGFDSSLEICPTDSRISIAFQKCNVDVEEVEYDCLGHWGEGGEDRFIVLKTIRGPESLPRFRCGLIRQEENGTTFLTLSADATCRSDLNSATFGFETFELQPRRVSSSTTQPPLHKRQGFRYCSFPGWTRGRWEDDLVVYVPQSPSSTSWSGSLSSLSTRPDNVTLESQCLRWSTMSSEGRNKFLIHTSSKCGTNQYNCVWFARRGLNVIEAQFGRSPSSVLDLGLCNAQNFIDSAWKTYASEFSFRNIFFPAEIS